MTISVVTDSTSDIPRDLATKHGITIVPLNVHFGGDVYRDGVDLQADDFYARLQEGKVFPTTSQPSVGAFVEVYRELADRSDTIISLHLSSRVSGTHNSAIQARQELGDSVSARIEVIDTLQASMSLGHIVLRVAEAVQQGADVDAAMSLAETLMKGARFFGLLSTLEYLQKGGRIGRAQAFLGGLLKVNPILSLVDGVAHPVERPRTRAKGLMRLRAMAEDLAPVSALSVLYSTDAEMAARLGNDLSQISPPGGIVTAQFGPVLGTYLGPEAVGIALITGR